MRGVLTVSARLHRCLDISNALHGHAILVISVDVLVLKFANFINEYTKLVSDVRDVFVASFTPE